MHDARILRNSSLYQKAEQGDILTGPIAIVKHHEIGPYLVGDSAYPISPWLQKPFPEATRDRSEIQFNRELSSARDKIRSALLDALSHAGEFYKSALIVTLNSLSRSLSHVLSYTISV